MSHCLTVVFSTWQIGLLSEHLMVCGQLSHYLHHFPPCNSPTRAHAHMHKYNLVLRSNLLIVDEAKQSLSAKVHTWD